MFGAEKHVEKTGRPPLSNHKQMTRKQYFRANNYDALTWFFSVLSACILIFTIGYDFPGAGLIIFNLLPIAAIVLIQALGRRAYRNYMKIDKMKWTKQ